MVMTASGVGYNVNVQANKLLIWQVGDEIFVHTYLKVSDQAMDLYGFESTEEKEFFELLLTVSGVGPKAAMRVLSLGSIVEIKNAIARGDTQYLTAVQGMGKKTAERLCVELKSKIKEQGEGGKMQGVGSQVLGEVVDGLVALGYSSNQAREKVESVDAVGKTTEEILRLVLKN